MTTVNTGRIPRLAMALLQLADHTVDLEPPMAMRIQWDGEAGTWRIQGHLFSLDGEEAQLDLLGGWANALNGTLHLSEPTAFDLPGHYRKTYRQLEAHADLFGVAVHLDVHIAEHQTPWDQVAPAAGTGVPDDGRGHAEEDWRREQARREGEAETLAEQAELAAAA